MIYGIDQKRWIDRLFLINRNDRTDGAINFRCPICGDSRKNTSKRRGWLKPSKHTGNYYFTCYNCGASMTFYDFLEEVDSVVFEEYKLEINQDRLEKVKNHLTEKIKLDEEAVSFTKVKRSKRHNIIVDESSTKDIKVAISQSIMVKTEDISEFDEIKLNTKFFKNLSKGFESILSFQKYIDYCEGRFIPKEIYSKFFVYTASGKSYSNMLILPLYDNSTGKLYGFNARSIVEKIFHIEIPSDNIQIYNWFNIDNTLPVYIIESQFDSFLVFNSIAQLGKGKLERYVHLLNYPVFVYDADSSGYIETLKEAENGNKVALLFDILESNNVKDIGEYKKEYPDADIKKIIDDNTFSGDIAIMKLKIIRSKYNYQTSFKLNDWDRAEKQEELTLVEQMRLKMKSQRRV